MENLPAKEKHQGNRTGKRGHRPKIEIDWNLFENLCRIQCTLEELTGFLKCSMDTIERAVKKQYKKSFAEVFNELKGDGRASLRRRQWVSALNGNVVMQIWLGKQHLDQRDRPEENKDEREVTLRIIFDEKQGGNGEDKEFSALPGNRSPLEQAVRQTESSNGE